MVITVESTDCKLYTNISKSASLRKSGVNFSLPHCAHENTLTTGKTRGLHALQPKQASSTAQARQLLNLGFPYAKKKAVALLLSDPCRMEAQGHASVHQILHHGGGFKGLSLGPKDQAASKIY